MLLRVLGSSSSFLLEHKWTENACVTLIQFEKTEYKCKLMLWLFIDVVKNKKAATEILEKRSIHRISVQLVTQSNV